MASRAKGFWTSGRIGKFLVASCEFICRPGYNVNFVGGVGWNDWSYKSHFSSLLAQISDREGRDGVDKFYEHLLSNKDIDVTALALASILLYSANLIKQHEMLIMTHPDKRLRKAYGTYKKKLAVVNSGRQLQKQDQFGTNDFSLAYRPIES